jgi:hypothetical protein
MIPPAALCSRCGLPRTATRPLVLSWWAKPYCGPCCGAVMAEHDRAPERQPGRRDLPARQWDGPELIGEKPLSEWPWRDIIGAERVAMARVAKLPRCEACGRPMVCGQATWSPRDVAGALPVRPGRHWTCTSG